MGLLAILYAIYNSAKTAAASGEIPKLLLEVVPGLLPMLLPKMLLGLQQLGPLMRVGLRLLLGILTAAGFYPTP